jgi:carboxylate-amine ligase
VPDVPFQTSDPLTLGIEEEFVLVDAEDGVRVAPRADEILDGDWNTIPVPGGWFKAELLRCGIELTTAANANLLQLDVDLRALRDELVGRAEALGMHAVAIGMHPDLQIDDELVSPTEAHRAIARLHTRVGTLLDQTTNGIHVHVGVPSLEDAIRVTNALAGYVPLFITLSTNSPVVGGVRAPWRSARAEVLRRSLWAGPTPHITDVAEYRAIHALHQLENSGEQRFLWDVAPVPGLGTVEVRSFDAQPDADLTLGIATLVQGLAAHVLDGGELPRASESLERHTRWSALEYGTRARFLVPGRDEPIDVPVLVREAVELARPYAADLGNEPWLYVFDELLAGDRTAATIEAFESGGLAGLLAHCRLRADAPDPVAT